MKIVKSVKQYTLCVVYEPDVVDAHGDKATAEEIEKACWEFGRRLWSDNKLLDILKSAYNQGSATISIDTDLLKQADSNNLGVQHLFTSDKLGDIVESYILPRDCMISGTVIKAGTWLAGIAWKSEELWRQICDGKLTGLSMEGIGRRIRDGE